MREASEALVWMLGAVGVLCLGHAIAMAFWSLGQRQVVQRTEPVFDHLLAQSERLAGEVQRLEAENAALRRERGEGVDG